MSTNRLSAIVLSTSLLLFGCGASEAVGIETLGGVFTRLLEPGQQLPASKSEIFSTAADNQDQIKISVYRGVKELAKQNTHVAAFQIYGIQPAKRGTPQIEVNFNVSVRGRISVEAIDVPIPVFVSFTGFLPADQRFPSQERIDSFYKDLNAAEAASKTAKPASKETIEFLQEYLTNPEEFPGAIERARAALSLFRIDPESKLAQKNLVELMSFIRESDDARPDYLGIFNGLEEMGPRAYPICRSFRIDTLNRWHPDRKRAVRLFHNLCEHKNRK